MSSFWSIWIIAIVVITIVGCFYILGANLKNYAGVPEGEELHHEFDGIVELNNGLPKWWTYMFYFTLFWSIAYLAAYPGMGNFKGFLNWQSGHLGALSIEEAKELSAKAEAEGALIQIDREMRDAEAKFGPVFDKFASKDIEALVDDEQAMKIGKRLFIQNCAQCHGSDARGQSGFPNLTDNDWLYGGSPEAIKHTLLHGRVAAMPGWEASLGKDGVKEMTAYVLSLSGRKVNQKQADAGKAKFAMCAACHGMDGKGSLANGLPMGAPNLTDNVWLYGGSQKAVEATLAKGRAGVMPPWKDILGEKKVHILTAYVYSLSKKDKAPAAAAAE